MRTIAEKALWQTACRVGRALFWRDPRRWLLPLDYVRTRELPAIIQLIDVEDQRQSLQILDISSPQLMVIHLALARPSWTITYMNPFSRELSELELYAAAAGVTSILPQAGDARTEGHFKNESMDLVLSASVLEHVEDVGGERGDSIVMQNVARCLRPGGMVIISVPYSRLAFDEYVDAPVYGGQSGVEGRTFFQRFYDEESLMSRIVIPSGLEITARSFIGERRYYEQDPHTRLAGLLARTPLRFLLGRIYPWLARFFLTVAADSSSLRKPYIAIVKLIKR